MVHTVDSVAHATALDFHRRGVGRTPLRVCVQVNVSGEASKGGVHPENLLPLVDFIAQKCANLRFRGLMTIGAAAPAESRLAASEASATFNADFGRLAALRDTLLAHNSSLRPQDVRLSMGMSADFAAAVAHGSAYVRIGSRIFGERPSSSA